MLTACDPDLLDEAIADEIAEARLNSTAVVAEAEAQGQLPVGKASAVAPEEIENQLSAFSKGDALLAVRPSCVDVVMP